MSLFLVLNLSAATRGALQGINTDPAVIIEIEEIERELAELEARSKR